MNYRLMVFDFDGTLADSMAASVAIFRKIGPGLGLKPWDDLPAARGMPTRAMMKAVGITFWKLPKVVREFQREAAEHASELKLQPGMAEALESLAARGIPLGILSSNREDNIRKCLAANGVEQLFAFVIGYPHLFGKARALRRIRRHERIERADMIYIGDESRDVEAAHRARIAVAAVTWGYHTPELLRGCEPTYLLDAPGELLELRSTAQVPAPAATSSNSGLR